MATSGSIDLTFTRDGIIKEALQHLGVLAAGASPSADDLTDCSVTLNHMIKSWQSRGTNLWCIQRLYVFLQKDTTEYILKNGSGAFFSTELINTNLSAAAASSATTISVDSITDIAASDNIGILLDDGTMHWDVVSGTPTGSTVTLTTGLADAASLDATVYVYTTQGQRPYLISQANLVKPPTSAGVRGTEIPMEIIMRTDWMNLPTKTNDGVPNQLYWEQQTPLDNPTLYIWPQASEADSYLLLRVERSIEDFDAASDEADFPQQWYLALSYNLAVYLAPKYGKSGPVVQVLMSLAERALLDAEADDSEDKFIIDADFSDYN